MARINNYEESKQFEEQGNFDTFTLPDDGSSDKVQFLAASLNDILTYTTHEISALSKNGREYKKKVGCLKHSSQDPAGVCPLCDSGSKIKLARYIPLYSHTEKKVLMWERGSRFIESNWNGLVQRLVSQGKDVRNTVIEVVRNGRKGDTNTTYSFYPMESIPPVDVSGIEVPDVDGFLIASWTALEMSTYITTGQQPSAAPSDNSEVSRRPSAGQPAASYTPTPADYAAPAGGFTGAVVSNPEDAF